MIDDNTNLIDLFSDVLAKEHIILEYAENGLSGTIKVLEEHYKLIIMDINMPLIGGIEATKNIRKSEKRRNHICAFTAFPDQIVAKDKSMFNEVFGKSEVTKLLNHVKKIISYSEMN